MNRWVFNVSMAVGLGSTGLGVGVQFGAGYGLAAFGLLLIGLTMFAARVATKGEG